MPHVIVKLWPGKSEQPPKILRRRSGDFVSRQVSHTRYCTRYFRNIGGLVALAAIRLRRQVRRVRFDQNFLQRQSFRNIAKILRFRISRIPCKRNQEAHVYAAACVLERAAEAVQNAADARALPMLFEHI